MPMLAMLALSVLFHAIFLAFIFLLNGLLRNTQPFDRPKTFQLVVAPLDQPSVLPVPVNSPVRKQSIPQQKIASEPGQPNELPGSDAITNDREVQQEIRSATPVIENPNERASVPVGTPSPGPIAPTVPVVASGQPQRIGSIAELDNVTFEPVFSLKPNYPSVAQSAGITGYVDVDLVIGDNGSVRSFSIVTVKGHPAFGTETASVLPKWRFPPPRIKGKKTTVKYLYRIKFTLNALE
jgi:TonB family protein